jgi:hypothetical protein
MMYSVPVLASGASQSGRWDHQLVRGEIIDAINRRAGVLGGDLETVLTGTGLGLGLAAAFRA